MFMKDNISFSRKYIHICRAGTCCIILNTKNISDSKKHHKMLWCVETRGWVGYYLIDATDLTQLKGHMKLFRAAFHLLV